MNLDKESLINLICKHCEFYKESGKDLECGGFKILRGLLEKGVITPEQMKFPGHPAIGGTGHVPVNDALTD